MVKSGIRKNTMLRKYVKNKESYYVCGGNNIVYRNENYLLYYNLSLKVLR